MEDIPTVKACYAQWCALQSEVESYYHDKLREKKKLSQEKEFRRIKNAVIQEAECIRMGDITFEDADLAGHDEPEQVQGKSYACWELRQIIQNEAIPLADWDCAAEELERLAERGDAHAQYMMGLLYESPHNPPEREVIHTSLLYHAAIAFTDDFSGFFLSFALDKFKVISI